MFDNYFVKTINEKPNFCQVFNRIHLFSLRNKKAVFQYLNMRMKHVGLSDGSISDARVQ